jgi:hypothetical protein
MDGIESSCNRGHKTGDGHSDPLAFSLNEQVRWFGDSRIGKARGTKHRVSPFLEIFWLPSRVGRPLPATSRFCRECRAWQVHSSETISRETIAAVGRALLSGADLLTAVVIRWVGKVDVRHACQIWKTRHRNSAESEHIVIHDDHNFGIRSIERKFAPMTRLTGTVVSAVCSESTELFGWFEDTEFCFLYSL